MKGENKTEQMLQPKIKTWTLHQYGNAIEWWRSSKGSFNKELYEKILNVRFNTKID